MGMGIGKKKNSATTKSYQLAKDRSRCGSLLDKHSNEYYVSTRYCARRINTHGMQRPPAGSLDLAAAVYRTLTKVMALLNQFYKNGACNSNEMVGREAALRRRARGEIRRSKENMMAAATLAGSAAAGERTGSSRPPAPSCS
ncbi:hypothetical protein RR46_03018 [Papilio xuthus]|uniref:Uncharacterized protein n=1 Tax=Papilio xuthus TaxID=66420 RepID=A0A194Q9X9_PAPXU|nr:hypothetical protein RR46_03018 [Papilio xuthus]